ncbi:hypothetical protein HPP92_001118 [Vanilla planifolia]|uniref:Secreted protein n=1 Tax=Vanilla planifolia TaxID=51239 RepID=A0A835S3K1_VANPL|nr:hypothetical protein HPP92_001118 [Vanilla planifolia]
MAALVGASFVAVSASICTAKPQRSWSSPCCGNGRERDRVGATGPKQWSEGGAGRQGSRKGAAGPKMRKGGYYRRNGGSLSLPDVKVAAVLMAARRLETGVRR